MTREELKKNLKKELKKMNVENAVYFNLFMGKKQMEAGYGLISVGINYGAGWVDKYNEYEAELKQLLASYGCKIVGKHDDTNYKFTF